SQKSALLDLSSDSHDHFGVRSPLSLYRLLSAMEGVEWFTFARFQNVPRKCVRLELACDSYDYVDLRSLFLGFELFQSHWQLNGRHFWRSLYLRGTSMVPSNWSLSCELGVRLSLT